MNDTTSLTLTLPLSGTITVGAIPDNMVYWNSASRDVWGQFANTAVTTNSWEIEVNFE